MILIFLIYASLFFAGTHGDPIVQSVIFKNAEQLIRTFTYNLTIDFKDTADDQDRQLILMSQNHYYAVQTEESSFLTGISRSSLGEIVQILDTTDAFKSRLIDALDKNCPFYVDDEMRLTGGDKIVSYTRYAYMKHLPNNPGVDMHIVAKTHVKISLPQLGADMIAFLRCSLNNNGNQNNQMENADCTPPKNASAFDWLSYQVWHRARAITSFTDTKQGKIDTIFQAAKGLSPYLPADYSPVTKCDSWPQNLQITEEVVTPTLGLALGMARALNLTEFTKADEKVLKKQVTEGGARHNPTLVLNATYAQVMDLFTSWMNDSFIDEDFAQHLRNVLLTKRIFVRDLYLVPAQTEKTVDYARIFAAKDEYTKNLNVGSVFYRFKTKIAVETKPMENECQSKADMCTMDKVQFKKFDLLFKQYAVNKAVDVLTHRI